MATWLNLHESFYGDLEIQEVFCSFWKCDILLEFSCPLSAYASVSTMAPKQVEALLGGRGRQGPELTRCIAMFRGGSSDAEVKAYLQSTALSASNRSQKFKLAKNIFNSATGEAAGAEQPEPPTEPPNARVPACLKTRRNRIQGKYSDSERWL